MKEWKSIQTEKKNRKSGKKSVEDDITLAPRTEDNIFEWVAYVRGAEDTPYEGGLFELSIVVPQQYPIQPPKVTFVTKIFHPNIHFSTGEICLDILKNAWSAVYTLQ